MSDSPTVTLRGLRHDDVDALFALLNHEQVVRFTDDAPGLADEAFRERYMANAPGLINLVGEIPLPSGRTRLVGFARFQVGTRRRRHVAEVQIITHPDYFNTTGEEILVAQVIRYAAQWLPVLRIQVTVDADDTRMIALYQRQGFQQEATMRRYIFREGAYRDALLLAWLRHEPAVATPPTATATPPATTRKTKPRDDIEVRGCEAADWEDLVEVFQGEKAVWGTLQLPYPSRDTIRERLENTPDNLHLLVAVIEEQVIGHLGLSLESGRQAHAASLGMTIHDDFQGVGVGSALMEAAIELAEEWLNVSRLWLEVYTDNAVALALYRKFGFEIEGTMRQYAFREGQYVDTYIMSRIRDEAI